MTPASSLAWDHWHIELSSICALKCPRCPRAEVPESLLNQQLTLKFFQEQLGQDIIGKIKKITFCGNDGDPIYCRDFIEICQWIKQINPQIQLVIITNGSYKTAAWWKDLSQVLNEHDEINWSLDGWDQSSNEQYRINSNWSSIEQGIQSFFSNNHVSYRVWAAIAFRFNQDFIDYQRKLAISLEFDLYQLTKSTKFGSKYPTAYGINDALEPTNDNLVAAGHRFEREQHPLSEKIRPGQDLKKIYFQRAEDLNKNTQQAGICLIGNKGVFLSSRGEFYPCCWTANRYEHNANWHQLATDRFNLHKKTFAEIINDDFWTTEFLKFESLECVTKCTRDKLLDTNHTTEW